ncbi:hypothetical protein BH23PLA1_BH23PLA1_31590 [soil metagenome]
MSTRLGNVNPSNRLRLIRPVSQRVGDLPEGFWQSAFELLHADIIDPRRAVLRRHLLERRQQVPFREDLVKEPEPLASFHSVFQSRQHAHGPDRRFDPSPTRGDLSGLLSHRHCRRFVFGRSGHVASISLEPFAPPALPGFITTMAPLTPAGRVLRTGSVMNARLVFPAGLSASCAWPSDHSVSNHPVGLVIALPHYPSASRASGLLRSGLRLTLAGSPRDKAESSSLALRTGRSPPVAPHPASRRRSYVQLQAGECMPEEDFHLSDQAHLQTHYGGHRPPSFPALWMGGGGSPPLQDWVIWALKGGQAPPLRWGASPRLTPEGHQRGRSYFPWLTGQYGLQKQKGGQVPPPIFHRLPRKIGMSRNRGTCPFFAAHQDFYR